MSGPTRGLRDALGLPPVEVRVGDLTQQLAEVDTDVMDLARLRRARHRPAAGVQVPPRDGRGGRVPSRSVDEWGAGRRMPLDGGMYFDTFGSPLGGDVDAAAIDAFPWPDRDRPGAVRRPRREAARRIVDDEGRAVLVGSICGGPLRGPVQDAGVRGRLHGPGRGARRAPGRSWRRSSRSSSPSGTGRLPQLGDTWTSSARRTTWAARTGRCSRPRPTAALVKPLHRELFSFLHSRTVREGLLPHAAARSGSWSRT